MTGPVRHRGPDDEGFHVEAGVVALGFRRLSIIDLDGGHQPLYSEDGAVAVTCNGEIYNFRALRSQLEARGHSFRTGSDAEVIAHLYEERGDDCLDALQGMFAVALWDARERRLLLACDRMGVKPLYWAEVPGGLVYGSEPGALLASGLMQRRPDPAAIMRYLTLQYVPAPFTGFEGMRKLAPGERLSWTPGEPARVETWWRLNGAERTDGPTDADVVAELDTLLEAATRARLIADVPLGAFLSGGVDSSLVVAYMAGASARVKTFSVDVPMTGYSESAHAQRVARAFGTDHSEYTIEAEMVPSIANAVRAAGEPFADASAIPTYLISAAARRHVTVALSGDGGDEAFGGYHRFLRALQFERLEPLAPLARAAVGAVPDALLSRAPVLQRRLQKAALPAHDRYAAMVTHFGPSLLDRLCTSGFKREAGGTRIAWDGDLQLPAGDGINRYCRLDTTTYLPGDILVKVDRMSMAHALEVRSPLLDYRVQQFAASLPGRFKLRSGETKWILKELAKRRGVPPENVHREKMGFAIPVGQWFRGSLRAWLVDLLESPESRGRGYFDSAEVSRLLYGHLDGTAESEAQLWNLAMLELWHRSWIDPK